MYNLSEYRAFLQIFNYLLGVDSNEFIDFTIFITFFFNYYLYKYIFLQTKKKKKNAFIKYCFLWKIK